MLSSTLIIGVAFVPLFTLTGVAGVIFSPMAHTYAFAIGGAIILALVSSIARAGDVEPRTPKLGRFGVAPRDLAASTPAGFS